MEALQLGPLVLPWGPVLVVLGYAAAVLAAWRMRRSGQADAEPVLFALLLLAMLAAHISFVALHWQDYRDVPAMLDIRDLGFAFWPGAIAALLGGALWLWRRPALRRPLALSAFGGIAVAGLAAGILALMQPRRVPLPALILRDLQGRTVALERLRGQPLVLNLWATWCPPCRRELPLLVQAARSTPGVRIVLVDQGQDAATVRAYLAAAHLDPPMVLLDSDSALLRAYHSPGLPTTLFIGANGRLASVHVGELSRATLAQQLAALQRTSRVQSVATSPRASGG